MTIFVVVFFLSDMLRHILKCNCSPNSTLMTMYLPGAILCSNVLKYCRINKKREKSTLRASVHVIFS